MAKSQLPTNFKKHTSTDPSKQFFIRRFYKTLVKTVAPLGVSSILDAGCGEGFTLNTLSESNVGKKLEGIDYAKDALSIGHKMFPNLLLRHGSIYDLPYKQSSFDLVICTEVLEHLENPQKALAQLSRVSKKYVLVTVPNEPFFRLSRLLKGMDIGKLGNHPEHIQHWTFSSFPRFVKNKGLQISKVRFPFPWIMILAEK